MVKTVILNILLTFVVLVSSTHAGKLGLVSAWLFEERSGDVIKDVVGTHDGVIIGKLNRTFYGKIGSAIRFSGKSDSHIRIPHGDVFNAASYTFVAWVKLKPASWQYIVWRNGDAWPESEEIRHMDIWIHDEGFPVFMWTAGKHKGQIDGPTVITDDRWHHIAKVYDGEKVMMFIDGELDGEKLSDGTLDTNESPIWIGARPGGIAATGLFDEVGFFTQALSEDEVNAVKNSGLLDFAAVDAAGKTTITWAYLKARK
ncbi:LamG domain-containing protein [Candidatus Poribacteria bacterium]|nr:LamG domain-containing protein [Candidatus Poribacteria bacterium]MYB66858.1 LamG domain-containing protein [Candidatus Poribacteria bacterium]MYF54891.1 LamG domain-containing protein [Candidatus Poribacteria bacterium]